MGVPVIVSVECEKEDDVEVFWLLWSFCGNTMASRVMCDDTVRSECEPL